MPRFALKIEYHGLNYSGWQRQNDVPSIQAVVERALRKLDPYVPQIAAAGRTDAGVHAYAQVAHCDMKADWIPFRLQEALNFHLRPDPVAIRDIAKVDDDWHARFSAIERGYLYRIVQRRAPLTHDLDLAWHSTLPLDVAAMDAAAKRLLGTHDFTTFRSSKCQGKTARKTLDHAEVTEHHTRSGREIHCIFRARSFLHNQIRSIVGTLERVGGGYWTGDDVTAALESRDRTRCGPVAPPGGLYFTHVRYGTDPFA